MATERRGAALLDGGHDLQLGKAQVAALGGAPGGPVGAEDVADLDGGVRHRTRLTRKAANAMRELNAGNVQVDDGCAKFN
jgi:hypothetical protein